MLNFNSIEDEVLVLVFFFLIILQNKDTFEILQKF